MLQYLTLPSFRPVTLLADPRYVRAFPGGCGFAKMGSNYGPTIWVSQQAAALGCHQVLWLFGPDHEVTEVGAMNVFALLSHGNGQRELVTPPVDRGIILPGVTRRSVIEMAQQWNEFEVNERTLCMEEVVQAVEDGTLLEAFGSGTAAVVTPIGAIHYMGRKIELPCPQDGLTSRYFNLEKLWKQKDNSK